MTRMGRTAVLVVTACAAWVVVAPAAVALCAAASEEHQFDQAVIVFEGVAHAGDSVNGSLLSPAVFQVERYLKGDGPSDVQVTTATSDAGDGRYMMVSVGIDPAARDRWRIYATGPEDGVWTTSTCHGSRRLASGIAVADAGDAGGALADDPAAAGSPPLVPLLIAMLMLAGLLSLRLVWQRGR